MALNDGPLNGYSLNGRPEDQGPTRVTLRIGQRSIAVTQARLAIGQRSSRVSGKATLRIGQASQVYGRATLALGQHSITASKRVSLRIGQTSQAHGVVGLAIGQQSVAAGVTRADMIGWRLQVTIDGVDVSDRLASNWSIDSERGLSRIAEFKLVPLPGPVETMEYYRKPVSMDFLYFTQTGKITHHLFTGRILEPSYDVDARLLSMRCSDLLQERLDGMTQAQLDAEIGGYFSEAVYDASMTGWDRARIMTLSQAGSYDVDRFGQGRFYTWQGGNETHAYARDQYVAGSIRFTQANAGNIHNTTVIKFDYRFTRKRWRDYTYRWEMEPTVGCQFLNNPFQLPQRSMIQSACESAGWTLKALVFTDLPKPQSFSCMIHGQLYQMPWGYELLGDLRVPDPDLELLCQGFVAKFEKKWAQTVTEQYEITVQARQSIDRLGALKREVTSGLETEFDGEAWESQEDTTDRHRGGARLSVTQDRIKDVDDETEVDRTEMEKALATLQAVAVGELLQSHRQNYLSWEVMLDPRVERHHRASLVADGLDAEGHVYQVVHRGDMESGEAITTLTIDLSLIGASAAEGAGITPAIQAVAKPDSDVSVAKSDSNIGRVLGSQHTHIGGSVTSPPFNEAWTGFMTNYGFDEFNDQPFNPDAPEAEMYPVQFVLPTPEIESELRQAIDVNAEPKTLDLILPVDRFIQS